jgi:DNA primase large subunit
MEEARHFVAKLLAEELEKAVREEKLADLERVATLARINRCIERGDYEPTYTGWSWEQGRRDANVKHERALDRLNMIRLAVAMANSGMADTVSSVFPVELADLTTDDDSPAPSSE